MVVSFVSYVCPYVRVMLIKPLLLSKLKITKSGAVSGPGRVKFYFGMSEAGVGRRSWAFI